MIRWFNELWNENNENTIDEILHHEVEAHGLGGAPLIGTEAFREFYKAFIATYTDIKVTIEKMVEEGDSVVVMCKVEGVHKATHNKISFSGISVSQFAGDKVVKGWNYFDFLGLNLQIGKISAEQLL